MPTFAWKGTARGGAPRSGEITADSKSEVRQELEQREISPIEIEKKESIWDKDLEISTGVGLQSKVVFTRQFATMIDAGLPLVQCLDLLAEAEPDKTLKRVIEEVKADIESGSTLADAMREHPNVFDTLYVSLVEAGEVAGILDEVLERLAMQLEKASELRRTVRGALIYPVVLVVVSIGVIFVMLYKVIPMFKDMFADMGGGSELPDSTQFVVQASNFLQNNVLLILGGVAVLCLAGYALLNYRPTRAFIDKYSLQAPVIGPVIQKTAVARFTRTLGTMVRSGVPIIDSLEIVASTAGNMEIEKALNYTKDSISQGENLADPLLETDVFPPLVVQMIGVGESTGELDAMLGKIADFYEDEVDAAVENLTSLLEPMIMVVMGGTIGGLLIAMYMPIFTMSSNM